jgi:hypothetical protein
MNVGDRVVIVSIPYPKDVAPWVALGMKGEIIKVYRAALIRTT